MLKARVAEGSELLRQLETLLYILGPLWRHWSKDKRTIVPSVFKTEAGWTSHGYARFNSKRTNAEKFPTCVQGKAVTLLCSPKRTNHVPAQPNVPPPPPLFRQSHDCHHFLHPSGRAITSSSELLAAVSVQRCSLAPPSAACWGPPCTLCCPERPCKTI